MTHLAVADEPAIPTTDAQLDRFEAVLADLVAAGIDPGVRHAANSAATIACTRVRTSTWSGPGIAVYGIPPAPVLAGTADLRAGVARGPRRSPS